MTESKYWSLKPCYSNLAITFNGKKKKKKLVKYNNISMSN